MSNNDQFAPILVADVGGTNARFAIVESLDLANGDATFSYEKKLQSNDFENFEAVLAAYLESIPVAPTKACFALAGPKKNNQVYLTNLGWVLDCESVSNRFGFAETGFINDFAALAYASPYVDGTKNLTVKAGTPLANANIAVLGPGTGFGAAALIRNQSLITVLSCEAGHTNLAPQSEHELALLQALRSQHERVSIEHVLCGKGLVNLYQAVCLVEGAPVVSITPDAITASALNNSDRIAKITLNTFCNWLGSVAGDLALSFNAASGVVLGGGILPRFTELLLNSEFSERFNAKGKMAHFNQDIPVTLITQDNIPLLGAAACMQQKLY